MKRSPRALNPRQIEAFRAVMISGSITRGGRLLSISQPAVTRLIRDLEVDLGLTLFSRDGVTVTPTTDARAFFAEVERHFISTERLREAAMVIREHGAGRIRIAAIPTLSVEVMPDAVAAFAAEHPGTLISVHSGASADIVDTVASGMSDVGFIARPPGRDDLEYHPLPDAEVVCILPASHPLAAQEVIGPADLHEQDYIALGPSSLMRLELNVLLHATNSHPKMRVESLFSGTVVHYVDRGMGIAIIDPLAAAGIDSSRTAVRRFWPAIQYELSVVYAPSVARSQQLERLIQHVTAAYEAAIARIEGLISGVPTA
ncbi:transcriptional regulator, LysR family [Rubellimicrobium mesophilum DSM 19309]|uniref:Transcriptional regulator, LysR family n=1 Tax=Rubellimicrobium mesophilum DSM 19309 TaxID=442562 RepID=A0A017HV67_9RHOB|nr:LysR family transcriptional regulator [Rubellimicrobium mesophilum]EYD78397.1 transcriptional regulator, LysR family [Rubellimicrobium mesophilum DSM 19309]